MSSAFRKLAIDMLIDMVGNPAENVWRDLSFALYQAQGPQVYERALVPGFPETRGAQVLWGGEGYDDGGEFAETEDEMKDKKKAKRSKRVAGFLKKIGEDTAWEYEEGGRQDYWPESNPRGREYSLRRERDNEAGIGVSWDQIGEKFYRDSEMPEPAMLNQDNYNTGTTHVYKTAVIEPDLTESQSFSHTPGNASQARRTMETLHAFVTAQDPMTAEVTAPGQKHATLAPQRVWDYPHHAQWNDERTQHTQLPGKKPVVRDAYDELNANNVWDEHDAFMMNKGIMDYVANPGPAV